MKLLITNMMYVSFPLVLYFLIIAYNKNINQVNNSLILEFSLFISLFFSINFSDTLYSYHLFYLLNIPILLAYKKKRNSSALLLSFISILYMIIYCHFNYALVILNFIILFLIYKFDKKYFSHHYIFVNCLFFILYLNGKLFSLAFIIDYLLTVISVLLLVKYTDKIMSFYMTMKDIQNNKQLQDSLFKISHEIKNPIAVCKCYLELVDGSLESYNKYIPIVNNEINHSLSILKDFSSIGKLKVDLDIMDINMLLDDVISNFKIMFEQKNIELEYDTVDDEILVNGDYLRLKEVLINILKNSVEAMENTINPKIKILIETNHERVLLHFIDNGCGIDEESIKKVATPFFTTKKNGTGLGTYLSREIIECHNGSMEYFSKLKAGTQVLIKLNIVTI